MKKEKIIELVLDKCNNVVLLTYAGSLIYGTQKEGSDIDIQGVCLPSRDVVFGLTNFEQQEFKENVYGFEGTVYNIKKYFQLAMNGNPNVLETLFVEPRHILSRNEIGQQLIDIRKEFLSKKCYHSFSGYAFSQLRKLQYKEYKGSKRRAEVEKYGFSLKNGFHLVRLLKMGIQILVEQDLSVLRPERQLLLAIRNGEYKLEEIEQMADELKKQVDYAYMNSQLRNKCNYDKLNEILVKILETHFRR